MADTWLIVVSVIVSLLLLAVSFYLLVYYTHPDDRSRAYVPKALVVLAFTLSEVMILMLALDVANQSGNPLCNRVTNYNFVPRVPSNGTTGTPTTSPGESAQSFTPPCGDLDIITLWTAMWFLVFIFVVGIIPLSIFFYDANEESKRSFNSKVCEALQYQGVTLVAAGLIIGLMYSLINQFSLPILVIPNNQGIDGSNSITKCTDQEEGVCLTVDVGGMNTTIFNPNTTNLVILSSEVATGEIKQFISLVPNGFGTYLACFLSFIGWWLFCIYTGVGLVTMPVDLIKSYLYRPKYIPKDVYVKLREDVRERLIALMQLGEKLKKERKQYDAEQKKLGYMESRRTNSAQRTAFKEFKKAVLQLETDYQDIRLCHEAWSSYNPLVPFVKLGFGILSAILSICWILQILLFILPQYWPTGASYIPTFFLNDLITWGLINSGFTLLGVIFIAIFGLYLLACNIQGNFKIGLRFMIMEIHPMKPAGTYLSSFLVNVLLLLLQTPALINFLAQSFSNTIVLTDIDLVMNYAVRYTTFFVYFFENNVFIFLLLSFTILALCLTYVLPDDNKKNQKRLKKKIEKMASDLNNRDKSTTNSKLRGLELKNIVKQATQQREQEAEAEEAAIAETHGNPFAKGAVAGV